MCDSKISTVGQGESGLMYHGYSINDLSSNCLFEEVAYLLTRNKLPNKAELNEYIAKLNAFYNQIPLDLLKMLELMPKYADSMDVMKAAVVFLGAAFKEENVFDADEMLNICDRLVALLPVAMCYHFKFHQNIHDEQSTDLSNHGDAETISSKIIRLLHGSNAMEGRDAMIDAINKSLICYAEHGLAASTFCARVSASTLTDSYSAVCSGICTLKGPLHGGANEAAMELIDGFDGDAQRAKIGIDRMLNNKEVIMGFGHRIYKNGDPRSSIMKKAAISLALKSEFAAKDKMSVAQVIEKAVLKKKGIHCNMDFYAALVYDQCGIPKDLYTPLFVCSRTTGWIAHVIEQRQNNKLIRPSSNYVGPTKKEFVPIEDRV